MESMRSWVYARGNPKHLVQKEMKKIKFTNINRVKRQKGNKEVTFLVTYHPLPKSLQNVNNMYLSILYMDQEAKKSLHA